MKELMQISQAVIDALSEAGVQAMAAFPPERVKQYDGAVAAVSVGTAEGKAVGFCNYLGQVWDEEAGTVEELYGKQLGAVITVEIRAARASLCEEGCAAAAEVLLGGLPVGIRAGELNWEAISWEKATGMFLRRSSLSGGLYGQEPGGWYRLFGLYIEGSCVYVSVLEHERPGVYSTYDASAVVSAGQATKIIGVAAKAAKGTEKEPVTVTGYTAGVEAFGEDAEMPGMSTILRLLFANGASTVVAVRVAESGELADYQAAFAALADQDVQILVCDSADVTVQQALRTAVEEASASRRERIAVVGGNGESAEKLVERAAQLNSERMVLVGPDALDSAGETISGVFMAAAVAGVIASNRDPAVPLNGAEVKGLGGVAQTYSDNEVDLLVRGGVTPMESVAGVLSPIRGITTRTTIGEAADTTWRELTTILIVDDLIPSVRNSLRSKFTRTKNTAQTRSAIRSQVIVELEKKKKAEIIDEYGDVTVTASENDPTVCLVEFSFAVAHGLNQIYLTVHITV